MISIRCQSEFDKDSKDTVKFCPRTLKYRHISSVVRQVRIENFWSTFRELMTVVSDRVRTPLSVKRMYRGRQRSSTGRQQVVNKCEERHFS